MNSELLYSQKPTLASALLTCLEYIEENQSE